MVDKQLLTSKNEHWCTPEKILKVVRTVGPIKLDPCSNNYSTVDAETEFLLHEGHDGLVKAWYTHDGLVFVNPPYGRKLRKWTKKMAAESIMGAEIVALLPARVDTKWCQEDVFVFASAVCFVKGRIKFVDGVTGEVNHPSPFPSMIAYYGDNVDKFQKACASLGKFVRL